MIVVGLTGGIGSGKSTIARFFEEFGIPVYIADDEARRLMHTSRLVEGVTAIFGTEAYIDGNLNRSYIADIVFNDAAMLQRLNAIVHPAVAAHFETWSAAQDAPYVLKEAAILFENGGYKTCDFTILVTAPVAIRLKRVIKRDGTDEKSIRARMDQQWEDEKKVPLADFVIENIDLENSKKETRKIHVKILRSLVNS
ncbi:dephospho-CoA kinase [Flavimarina sp. Hel_I_48]|uniref:dephospho-CoA kinase n=1 Tax=Flavimarina sp. Hel_I_48 TaxID=1392488 RepID=UPI0004DF8D5B|nr:dephospho-CoA kinase [Flavimarina sp. Hel_I_48]